jgi:hypothetical protein
MLSRICAIRSFAVLTLKSSPVTISSCPYKAPFKNMLPQKRKERRISRSAAVVISGNLTVSGKASWAAAVNVSPWACACIRMSRSCWVRNTSSQAKSFGFLPAPSV